MMREVILRNLTLACRRVRFCPVCCSTYTSKTFHLCFHLNNQAANKKFEVLFDGEFLTHDFEPVYLGLIIYNTLIPLHHDLLHPPPPPLFNSLKSRNPSIACGNAYTNPVLTRKLLGKKFGLNQISKFHCLLSQIFHKSLTCHERCGAN